MKTQTFADISEFESVTCNNGVLQYKADMGSTVCRCHSRLCLAQHSIYHIQ